jgi:hypothetical protein
MTGWSAEMMSSPSMILLRPSTLSFKALTVSLRVGEDDDPLSIVYTDPMLVMATAACNSPGFSPLLHSYRP